MSIINPQAPLHNVLLQNVENKIEGDLLPKTKANYLKIVAAGMKAALQGDENSIIYKLKDSQDPVRDCALGAVHLALILRRQSRGTMPLQSMIPAAATLMLKALDFASSSKLATIDTNAVVRASHIFTNEIFKSFQISPKMIQHAGAKVHALTQDPVAMKKMRIASGFEKLQPPVSQQLAQAQPKPLMQG
jgi:hypothetical protein